jgi:glycosyltransferase involved in cell wall biosynthesis
MRLLVKKPNISVVMPAYNAEDFIAEAIDSILGQTCQDFELIIIDDASTDKTSVIIEQYTKKDNRLRVYRNKSNKGIGANRSYGVKLAKGRYICWQDADDISIPERLQLQKDYLDNHPSVGVVGGFIEFFDEKSTGPVRTYAETDSSLRKSIFRYNPVAQPASMFRRECFDKVGLYDESYKVSEDLEMLFRVGVYYEFANVQQVVLKYRQLESSLTRSNLRRMESTTLKLRKEYSRNSAYTFTFFDRLFNLVQQLTLILMPTGIRMSVFRIIRGDK